MAIEWLVLEARGREVDRHGAVEELLCRIICCLLRRTLLHPHVAFEDLRAFGCGGRWELFPLLLTARFSSTERAESGHLVRAFVEELVLLHSAVRFVGPTLLHL